MESGDKALLKMIDKLCHLDYMLDADKTAVITKVSSVWKMFCQYLPC